MVQKAGWAPGPVWAGVENLAPTGIPSQDHPARSKPLITGIHATVIIVQITTLVNLLATDFFFQILAHPVFKM